MTLNGVMNGVMAVTLRYFTEFGIPHIIWYNRVDLPGRIYARVYCIFSACTMSS